MTRSSPRPLEPLTLKGVPEPVIAYRVLKVDPGATGFARRLDAPMVGRERELALLRDAFDRAISDDACQLFTVLGIGGVGKSRLLAAFLDGLPEDVDRHSGGDACPTETGSRSGR